MGYSDSAKNSMLTALGAIATYASLHSADPSTTGASELAGGTPAYARKSVTFGAAAAGEMTTSNQPIFDVPAGVVLYVGFWTAASGGTFLGGGELSPAPDEFTEQGLFKVTSSILDLNSIDLAVPIGTAAGVVTAITASVTGYMLPLGSVAATLAELLPASIGYLLPKGTAASSLSTLTADADGTVGSEVTGTVAATLSAFTSSGTGLLVPKGTVASDLAALTASSAGGQAPLAPTGHSVDAGDALVTMHPGTSTGATSYNAYWTDNGADPTKASNKITGVTDAQEHTTLTNDTLYKYVFTAVSSLGEGPVSSVVSATPTSASGISDDFNRANGGLGANWTAITDNNAPVILTNQAHGTGGYSGARWSADAFANNQFATCYFGGTDQTRVGPRVRVAANANTYYGVQLQYGWDDELGEWWGGHSIFKVVNGTYTELVADYDVSSRGAGYYRLEVSGSNLSLKFHATDPNSTVSFLTTTDSSIASGSAGVGGYGTWDLDNFSAGDLA